MSGRTTEDYEKEENNSTPGGKIGGKIILDPPRERALTRVGDTEGFIIFIFGRSRRGARLFFGMRTGRRLFSFVLACAGKAVVSFEMPGARGGQDRSVSGLRRPNPDSPVSPNSTGAMIWFIKWISS